MNRSIVIALALSLAANVFLGGYVAGRIGAGPHRDRGPHGHDLRRPGDDFADLTPAARESLKRIFVEHREGRTLIRREASDLTDELAAVLSAQDFDRAAAEAIVDRLAALESRGRAGMMRLIIDAAEGLGVDDRRALAQHLKNRSRDHHRRGPDGPRSPADQRNEG